MSETDGWLSRYEETHQDLTYPVIYWAAVPMVVLGTVGLFWVLPIPDEFFEISPLLNWGSAFLMASAVYYFIISLSIAIGMLPFLIGVAAFHLWLGASEFAELRAYHYQSGVVFAAFVPGEGQEVARGGRYDEIGEVLTWPATHDQVVAASKLVPDDIVQMITASGRPDEVRAKVEAMEQGEQLFVKLKLLGKETEMVRFAGESHGLSRGGRPQNRAERLRLMEQLGEVIVDGAELRAPGGRR